MKRVLVSVKSVQRDMDGKDTVVELISPGTKMTALPTHKILRQVFFFLTGCVVWLSGCFSVRYAFPAGGDRRDHGYSSLYV